MTIILLCIYMKSVTSYYRKLYMAVSTAHVAQLVGKNPSTMLASTQAERADWHVIVQKLVAPGCKLNGWTLAAKDSIDSDHPQDGQKNDVKSRKLSWPIAKGQHWLGTIGKAPWGEVSRWSPKPCPIQLSMLEPANEIRVQLASYAFEEVFSQPPLRVKDGETRWAFMPFWKNI